MEINKNFNVLTTEECVDVTGGAPLFPNAFFWVVVGALALGVYNGYNRYA